MDYEKKYNEALERAKYVLHTAETAGCAMHKDLLTEIFPELRESEDERIRKELLDFVRSFWADHKEKLPQASRWLAYLEKQKQKPAWSEEDEKMLTGIIERGSVQVPPYTTALREEQIEWLMNRLKSLRSCPKSSDNWKPSEEQMKTLNWAANGMMDQCIAAPEMRAVLRELYEQLKKL